MQANRLILFFPSTLLGFLYSLIFRDPFDHAAIEVDGQIWDSDLSRGWFGRSNLKLKERPHIALEFETGVTDWLVAMNGRKHKWWGFWGWLFHAEKKSSLYNFEMVWLALLSAGVVSGDMPVKITGLGLLRAMLDHEKQINSGSHGRVINLILRAIGFSRKDEITLALRGPHCVAVSNSVVNVLLLATNKNTLSEALIAVSESRALHGAVSGKLHRLMTFIERCNGSV